MATVDLPSVFGQPFATLTVEGSHIAYEDSATTTPPLAGKVSFYCLPGIGDFRHSFRFLAPKLAAQGYRVICQDLRGVGDSGTKFASFTIEDCVRDVEAVLAHVGVKTGVVLVGNSLSAAVAVEFAADHSDVVAGVVTLGGFFRDMPADAYFRPLTPLLFNHLWGQPVWLSSFKSFFARPPPDMDIYCAAVKAKMLSNCDHASIIGAMIRASKEPSWAKIPQLKAAVLLLMGSKDPDFKDPAAELDFVAEDIGKRAGVSVTKKLVEGVGHYVQNEAVDETFSAIVEFVSTL
ncbi:Alpha/Beta hydrolase protein [Chytriomyces sp. MP71]|nr:Alpha/Beta hydrolase protein [Chytriomyces sp. MP71]